MVFTFRRLLNTSLYIIFLVYPYIVLNREKKEKKEEEEEDLQDLLLQTKKQTYNWP